MRHSNGAGFVRHTNLWTEISDTPRCFGSNRWRGRMTREWVEAYGITRLHLILLLPLLWHDLTQNEMKTTHEKRTQQLNVTTRTCRNTMTQQRDRKKEKKKGGGNGWVVVWSWDFLFFYGWGGGPYQDRTVNAGVAIGRGLPGGGGGLILK